MCLGPGRQHATLELLLREAAGREEPVRVPEHLRTADAQTHTKNKQTHKRPSNGAARHWSAPSGSAGAWAACASQTLPGYPHGADVGGVSPVLVQMWRDEPWCRCGGGEPSLGADAAGVSPVPVQMWQGVSPATSRLRCHGSVIIGGMSASVLEYLRHRRVRENPFVTLQYPFKSTVSAPGSTPKT
jgi:hypothetical protein